MPDITFEDIDAALAEVMPDEGVMLADGFEGAFIGMVEIFNKVVACYDREACLRIPMDRDGMDHDEAVEFFDFNVVGAWVGEKMPAFLDRGILEIVKAHATGRAGASKTPAGVSA